MIKLRILCYASCQVSIIERLSSDNDSSNDIRELGGIPLLITLIQLVIGVFFGCFAYQADNKQQWILLNKLIKNYGVKCHT